MKITHPCPTCKGEGKLKRDCCHEEDLRTHEEFSKAKGSADSVRFCQYCGKIQIETSRLDAAGSREYFFSPANRADIEDLFERIQNEEEN